MRIYTRSGDSGDTGIIGPDRVPKDDPRIHAVGDVDELNAVLGLARAEAPTADLEAAIAELQSQLFVLGSDLASPYPDHGGAAAPRISDAEILKLEQNIDAFQTRLPQLNAFILPGGTRCAACLHLARTVCRRAERSAVALSRRASLNPAVIPYLNRLSDLLFVMARVANASACVPDIPWRPHSED